MLLVSDETENGSAAAIHIRQSNALSPSLLSEQAAARSPSSYEVTLEIFTDLPRDVDHCRDIGSDRFGHVHASSRS